MELDIQGGLLEKTPGEDKGGEGLLGRQSRLGQT